ncbi:MAG TPA: ABC-2 family transporter protein [Candidatus Limnocylindria bacterium]|nr:ABC-2 family transporter protein [Candidatus Limnocylindria bacterium]
MLAAARIYLALMSAGLRGELQYRANFVAWVVTGVVYQLTGFVFIWVVLARFQSIAGWTLGEVAFLYGLRLLGHGAHLLIFGYFHRIEWLVREGEFDRFLVRPVPALMQVIVHRFPIGPLGDFGGGVALFIVATQLVRVDWSPPALAFVVLTVLGAACVEAGLKLAIASLCFRFLSTRALVFVIDDLFSNFGNYPIRIFGGIAQFLLTFAIPVAFIAYLPATVLLGRTGELAIPAVFAYLAPLAGAVVFGLGYLLWRSEIRHYQSSGH